MSENILIFDVETTGTDPERDQIIELALKKGLDAAAETKSRRFKPSIPIPARATSVHGIRDEDVADCPPIKNVLSSLRDLFAQAEVIVGYNVKFDIEMLQGEFKRAAMRPLDLSGKAIIDPLQLWRRMEPRKLEDAVKRFAKRDHQGAHSALADVEATSEVLLGMLKDFGLGDQSWSELDNFINPEKVNWLGQSHHLRWQDGTAVFGFGKHFGRPVQEVVREDSSYLNWIITKDFPSHVATVLKHSLELDDADFKTWLSKEFGRSA